MTDTRFEDLTDVYEAMIDWPKRLANEEPFYRRLFAEHEAGSVVDVACGTGRHAATFHSWGLKVEGSDISPQMVERAVANFGQPPRLRWVVRGFDEPIESSEPHDIALCVGNSLALAPDLVTAERAIQQMLRAVRTGGAVVVHVLNLWHLPDGPTVWQKCKRTRLPRGEVLIIKGVHRSGSHGFVDLLVTNLQGDVAMQSESVRLLGLGAEQLDRMARAAGAQRITCFGGYQNQPYDPQASTDLVMVAQR
jgi:glycine/sarcosine N-methyltransferase